MTFISQQSHFVDCVQAFLICLQRPQWSPWLSNEVYFGLVWFWRKQIILLVSVIYDPSNFLAHVWIKRQLRQCIHRGYHWRNCALVPDEAGFIEERMRQSDQRNSFDDIWTLSAANVSLFYYNTTLAPLFFALNLAKFECTPNGGRRLRIIQWRKYGSTLSMWSQCCILGL